METVETVEAVETVETRDSGDKRQWRLETVETVELDGCVCVQVSPSAASPYTGSLHNQDNVPEYAVTSNQCTVGNMGID